MRIQQQSLVAIFLTAFALFCVICIIGITTALLGGIAWEGLPHVSWEFLTSYPKNNNTQGGIFPAIYGTALLVITMAILGVPVGAITAIYLTEYTKRNSLLYRSIIFAVNTLAGVPSIVFGLFGLGFFIQFVGKGIDSTLGYSENVWGKPSILWAAATLAALTLPVVIVSVTEALRSVPQELREASFALGANKAQTIFRVVLPHSINGILTGAILAVSRAAGEVAPILFTGAVYSLSELPTSLSDQFMELGYHIFVLSTQSPDVQKTLPLQFATTVVLLFLTFVLNFSAIYIRSRSRLQAATFHQA